MTAIVEFLRKLAAAVNHVRTGGKTTRTRARTRAAAPPAKCPRCRQPVPHSPDWRDHLHRP